MAVVSGVNTTPTLLMVHVDHLHRPVKMTNAAGTSVWSAVWLPWGGAHAITGAEINDARFPGQWFQLEAGLHYNWHRHYDPPLGRYTQPDPLGFVDGPSVYAYVGNRPFSRIDPTGLEPEGDEFEPPNVPKPKKPKTPSSDDQCHAPDTDDDNDNDTEPASEDTARDIAKQIERDLGKDARRKFHDAKEGGDDRTLEQLKQDARDLYHEAGKDPPRWLAE